VERAALNNAVGDHAVSRETDIPDGRSDSARPGRAHRALSDLLGAWRAAKPALRLHFFEISYEKLSEPEQTPASPEDGYWATPQQFVAAFRALPLRQRENLLGFSHSFSILHPYNSETPLGSILNDIRAGRRRWPIGRQNIYDYLKDAIRDYARRHNHKLKREHGSGPEDVASAEPSAEDSIIEREAETELYKRVDFVFGDRPLAKIIVMRMLSGLRGQELWDDLGVSEKTYESCRRLIKQRLSKYAHDNGFCITQLKQQLRQPTARRRVTISTRAAVSRSR